ncbi:MAG TPA: hypothetical protein VK642_16490 [Burkholderiales bacterium]|nr:hypothetical protein [Burkholderiales bacterium]
MTPQQLVGIGLRLFAIWLAISGISYVFAIPNELAAKPMLDAASRYYSSALGFAHFMAALLLWLFPMWIAHKIVPRTHFDNHLNSPAWELARVGCSLLGLWQMIRVLPSLAYFLFKMQLIAGSTSLMSALSKENKAELLYLVVELALGILLIALSGKFARFIARMSLEDSKVNS